MCDKEQLWKDFPRTQQEFDARFSSEQACAKYLAQLRFPAGLVCYSCGSEKMYAKSGYRCFCTLKDLTWKYRMPMKQMRPIL